MVVKTRYNFNISHCLCFCHGLYRNKVLHRHVQIVYLADLELHFLHVQARME